MSRGVHGRLNRGSEDVSDAIAKRSTDRLAYSWRHAGIAVLFLLSGFGAEPQPAKRLATARRGIGRESRKECRTRSGARRAAHTPTDRPTVRQPGASGGTGCL